jgi:conjugal transfer mating pair stabilization protein TraN
MNPLNVLRSHPFTKLFIILAAFIGMHQKGLSAQNAAMEKQAREKAIADRIAFEKDRAQKQIAQKEEDRRRAALREQRQAQVQAPPAQHAPSQAQAHQNSVLQDGRAFASSLLGNVTGAAKSTNPQMVPRFQTDRPKEAFLDNGSIGDAALAESRSNQVSQHLYGQAKDRQSFKIDSTTDPLLVEANQAIANPQKTLKDTRVEEEIEEVKEELGEEEGSEELKTCEESGEETLEEGEEFRVITVAEPKHSSQVHVYSHGWTGGLSRNVITGAKLDDSTTNTRNYAASTTLYNPLPQHLQSRVKSVKVVSGGSGYISVSSPGGVLSVTTASGGSFLWIDTTVGIEIICKPGEENVTETIVNNCQLLEEKVDKGLCLYEGVINIEGPETRVINDYPAKRDWWRRKKVYRCHYPAKNDCGALRVQGCFQIKSRCKEIFGNQCVLWEQTYSCPSGKRSAKRYRSSNKESPFCLTGDCADTSYKANNELLNVMSHLYALREAQNDLRNFKVIFKGRHRWCTRNCVDFRDCCGSGGGWGVSLHLSSCDAQEIELRTLRDKNLCIQVGTYCAEKLLGVCLRKKTGFCCYETKMARLIQEQGRAQLGLGFGSPECPDCAGLSPEQLSQLDFSRINFSEIFEDIKNQTVAKGQGQSLAQVSTERLQNNMTLLTKPSLDPKSTEELQKLKEKGL